MPGLQNSDFPVVLEPRCLTEQWSEFTFTRASQHVSESVQPGECQGELCFNYRTQRRWKIKLHAFTNQSGGCYASSIAFLSRLEVNFTSARNISEHKLWSEQALKSYLLYSNVSRINSLWSEVCEPAACASKRAGLVPFNRILMPERFLHPSRVWVCQSKFLRCFVKNNSKMVQASVEYVCNRTNAELEVLLHCFIIIPN